MRILSALSILVLLATFAPPSLYRPREVPRGAWVEWQPLSNGDVAGCSLGKLDLVEGWVLTSNHPEFGGLSGLHVGTAEAVAISDTGFVLHFPLARGGRVPLSVFPATGSSAAKQLRDSESLALRNGTAWIGFEHSNTIRRYRTNGWSIDGESAPEAMRDWPRKAGAETMVGLRDGRFLLVSESVDGGGGAEALLFPGDPVAGEEPRLLRYQGVAGFRPTDAAQSSDGRIYFLNRRYTIASSFSALLTEADLPSSTDQIVESREVGWFGPACPQDNFEAISITNDNGRESIWIASDDNFGPLQRTLILKFAEERP